MKEQYIGSAELTHRQAYSTLNIAHSFQSVGSTMPEPGQTEKPQTPRPANSMDQPRGINPERIAGMMRGANPQAAREVANAIVQSARESGQALTPDQQKLVRELGHVPEISGASGMEDDLAEALTAWEGMQGRQATPEEKADIFRQYMGDRGRTDQPEGEHREEREPRGRRGRSDEPVSVLESEGVTTPSLKQFVDSMVLSGNVLPHGFLGGKMQELSGMTPEAGEDVGRWEHDKEEILQRIRNKLSDLRKDYAESEEFRGFTIQKSDEARLSLDPIKWLNDQFDNLYNLTESGNELESENVRRMQSLISEAVGYLNTHESPLQKQFEELNNTRFNLLFMAKAVRDRSMESIMGASQRLRSSGIFTALSLEGRKVEAIFDRFQTAMDDARIRGEGKIGHEEGSRFHLSPELAASMGPRIEKEQVQLAIAGVGVFAESYKTLLDKLIQERGGLNVEISEDEVRAIIDIAEVDAKRVLEVDVRRTVKTAYDTFVSTQTEAVISARGRFVSDPTGVYFSDVGAVYNAFNIEDFTIGKWTLLNHEEQMFLDKIKLDLAEHESASQGKALTYEEKLDLGRRLFRDLFVVPDFFSSGWRIKGMRDQIEKIQHYEAYNTQIVKDLTGGVSKIKSGIGEEGMSNEAIKVRTKLRTKLNTVKSQDMADFVRDSLSFEERQLAVSMLRLSADDKKNLEDTGKKHAEDLALFMQLKQVSGGRQNGKKGEDGKSGTDKFNAVMDKIIKYRPEELLKLVRERDPEALVRLNAVFDRNSALNRVFSENDLDHTYDSYKKHFGPLMHALRENALREGLARQVDFGNLTPAEIAIAEKFGTGTAAIVKDVNNEMKTYIRNHGLVKQLISDQKYEDIYGRTLLVDDAILGRLEKVPENSGISKMSQTWSTEPGADAFKRNFNDIADALKAGGALIGFLKAEGRDARLKQAEEFSKSLGYNGTGGMAKGFRYTFGSFLLTSKQDYFWDILNVGKLPARQASSDIERIFGPGVSPMVREQLLHEMDHVRGFLTSADHDPEKYYRQLEALLGVDNVSMMKGKVLTVFLYLSLLLALVPALGAVKAVGEASK